MLQTAFEQIVSSFLNFRAFCLWQILMEALFLFSVFLLFWFYQLGHDNVTEESGWYVEKVEVDLPTKGKHYIFPCQCWLARDKAGGKTSRVFTLGEDDKSVVSYKPSKALLLYDWHNYSVVYTEPDLQEGG